MNPSLSHPDLEEPTSLPNVAWATTGLFALMISLIVTGMAIERPWCYLFFGFAFLAAAATTACGLWTRYVIETSQRYRGDLPAFLAIVLSQMVMLFFVLTVGNVIAPMWLVEIVFWFWFGVAIIYAFASAAPAVRLIMVCGVFLAIPLSILSLYTLQQREAARRNGAETNVRQIFRAFEDHRDTHRR